MTYSEVGLVLHVTFALVGVALLASALMKGFRWLVALDLVVIAVNVAGAYLQAKAVVG